MKLKNQIISIRIMALLSVLVALPFLFSGCDLVLSDDSDDDSTLLSLLLLTNSTSSSSGCNSCVTNNDSSLPAWIKDNFSCMTITVSGGNYVFTTSDLPPYTSGYYSTSSGCYTNDFPSGHSANPNVISSQNISLTIPATPNTSGSTTTTGPMGVGVNGVVLFNEDAAPGDTLSAELDTMDSANGHPTDIGMYHYHTEPYKLTNNNSALVGIALDGYPIFGRLETDNSTPGTSTPALDANGGHTHVHSTIGSSIYHYHVENTSNNLILLEDFHGSKGSTTF